MSFKIFSWNLSFPTTYPLTRILCRLYVCCVSAAALEKEAPGSWAINKGTKCFFLFCWGVSLGLKHVCVFTVAQFPYVKSGIVISIPWIPQCPEDFLMGNFQPACVGNTAGLLRLQEVEMRFRKVQRSDWALMEFHCSPNIDNALLGPEWREATCVRPLSLMGQMM